ncbi:MAG: biotin-dependent carboxyltransferase family protein [Aeromicrobium sp.]|uniref:5-oxoprolinase subunit C family protein n=1 Tax=Aeromicrobium sp. TaxID=1871063 RepID=UPI0039E4B089
MSLRVIEVTGVTLVEDLGRPGRSALGVAPSGTFDRTAMRQANALLGNRPVDAVLEVIGALTVRATRPVTLVVTGAPGPLDIDGRPCPHGRVLRLRAGAFLGVSPATVGVRRVLAVAGGIASAPVLGSRSRDLLAGLGPEPVRPGDLLPVGLAPAAPPSPLPDDLGPLLLGAVGDLTVRAVPGPRDDWFTPEAVAMFFGTPWTVSERSDRIGVRLDGPALERAVTAELASEPVVRGSIQVTSAGLPVVLGPDHPVTGGYPVIAVLLDHDTDLLAQAAPGRIVRFARHPLPG